MSERYTAPEIIALKRDRHVLNDDQIDWVVDAYTPVSYTHLTLPTTSRV